MYSKPHLFLIYFSIWWGFILILITDRGKVMTEWWQYLLTALCPAAITAAVSLLISRKSHLKSNTNAIEELSRRLGDYKAFSLEQQIGVGTEHPKILSLSRQISIFDESTKEQIGIGKENKSSLTFQHKEILDFLKSEKIKQDEAYKKFSKRQKNIARTTEDFKLFIEDWEKKTTEINELRNQIFELKTKLSDSMQQNNLDYPYNNEDEDESEF